VACQNSIDIEFWVDTSYWNVARENGFLLATVMSPKQCECQFVGEAEIPVPTEFFLKRSENNVCFV
jgi:hypothetical protein